jgi:hypothetical protein
VSLRPSGRARAKQRARRKAEEPGRSIWKAERTGECGVCGRRGKILRHHVVYEAHVRREGGDPWDLRNGMDVGRYCACHRKHHESGPAREPIPMTKVPEEAVAFAAELMGEDRASDYFIRYYRAAPTTIGGRNATS